MNAVMAKLVRRGPMTGCDGYMRRLKVIRVLYSCVYLLL